MGFFGSSEEENEVKTVDSNGNVNNNIIIQEAKDVHKQMLSNEQLLYGTYFLCFAEIIKIIIYLYNSYQKKLKKKYLNQQNRP